MSSTSPVHQGFRAALREPVVVLAEIAWRWSFGLAALALAAGVLFAYLDTIPVSKTGLLALRSGAPWLIIDAIAHLLRGSGSRLVRAVAMVVPAMAVLWIAAATLGRAATLKALLGREARIAFSPQLGLNFLRAMASLAALIGYLGAAILAGRIATGRYDVRPAVFLLVFAALAMAVAVVRSRLNWFPCLAAIPAAHGGCDTFSAIGAATGLFRRHAGSLVIAGAVFGTVHTVLFAFYTVICLLVFSLAGKVPPAVTLFLLAVITLTYSAAVDFLYIARLAAYIAIDDGDRMPPPAVVPEPIPPAPQPDFSLISGPGLATPEGAGS